MAASTALDEMVDGQGGIRPHWQNLLGALTVLGHETLTERAARLDRAFEEEGATSVLPGAEADARRCDPLPLLLSETEFDAVGAGLTQRARLFEAILGDVYGPQQLLAEGALPPALVYANPGFLRPCQAPEALGFDRKLRFYAADLVRGTDGSWSVLADYTGWADGVAAALENRRMLARVMPEIFHPHAIRQIHPFLDAWQDSLQRLAQATPAPAVALLTPGHSDPAWYDHVLLARELSSVLVEGADLTVRSDGVYLKTLRGLQPIGVVLRAMNGRMIDPLELEPDGAGAAGLLDAARGGMVQIVNDPGNGLTEAPALAAFLPSLAHRMLGETLGLAGLPTLWLGEPGAVETVLREPFLWAIRPAFENRGPPAALGRLSAEGRERLYAQIAEAPWRFAACRAVQPSTAPCVSPKGFVPRPLVMRVFLLCDGGRWQIMPGGLVRALPHENDVAWRMPDRGLAKDLWVLAESTGAVVGPGTTNLPALPIRRAPGNLPSRAADNFYWLGRYLERLEGSARLQRAAIFRIIRPMPTPHEVAELQILGDALCRSRLLDVDGDDSVSPDILTMELLRAARDRGPTAWLLGQVSRMTNLLRDRLTGEMYAVISRALRELTEALRKVRTAEEGAEIDELAYAMTGVLHFAATVAGLAAENMVRGGGRLFLDLGRRIERARMIAEEIACALDHVGHPVQAGRVDLALRLCLELRDSVITYRNRYLAVLQPGPALDLMLADEGNPRGLAFQLLNARDLLAEIAGGTDATFSAAAAVQLDETRTMVETVLRSTDQNEAAGLLPSRLRALKDAVSDLSDQVARRYFALLPAAHSVGLEVQPSLRGAA